MDPDRVRAYLQVACAGLGFDIGEIWWTTNTNTTDQSADRSLVSTSNGTSRNLRFVQLYTSKAYQNRRSQLVEPPSEDDDDNNYGDNEHNNVLTISGNNTAGRNHGGSSSAENLQKHVLSPRLVEAIAKTTQVVWANSRKREGLIGRSDIRLQTAVGMPVAVDDMGNMCVVVMFSPNNIHSSDDAMEYLQSISRSATTSSIPGLLPVFDPKASHIKQLTYDGPHYDQEQDMNSLGEGVTARYVSLDQNGMADTGEANNSSAEIHNVHDVMDAPKDTFGIPMLPTFAEIGTVSPEGEIDVEIFDEASYGIWTTIMDTLNDDNLEVSFGNAMSYGSDTSSIAGGSMEANSLANPSDLHVLFTEEAAMSESRKIRLEEFCSAFLDMSVFDLADVWVPVGTDYPDCLRHVTSVTSSDQNLLLDEFRASSTTTLIKYWTGAIGRAFSSGNPVWSANRSVFIDPGRAAQFERTKIMTVLAVPVFSGKSPQPACVVACYSMVKSNSVPFVLRFVQSALRLLWDGLDNVEPHESVDKSLWHDIAPADLGEMAADVEMQHHFLTKKRPRTYSTADADEHVPPCSTTAALASHLQTVRFPNGDTANVPFELPETMTMQKNFTYMNGVSGQDHSIGSAGSSVSTDHISTTANDTKRAHIVPMRPLPKPNRFPTTVLSSDHSVSSESSRSETEQNRLSAAVFFIPNQQVRTMNANHSNGNSIDANAEMFANIDFSSIIMDQNTFCMPTDDNDTISQESYGEATECRIIGCLEAATTRRPYCLQHSGNRLCEHNGCNKCAQGATRYCIAHGGGRRCTFPGCDKGARDKFFCAAHGGGKRCSADQCNKSAVGGSSFCTSHGGGRRCNVDGCDKSAQSSTKFCVKHGGGKKCSHDGCEKVARGRTLYCAAHGGGIRCKLDGCNRVAIGKLQLCRAHGGGARLKKNRGATLVSTAGSANSLLMYNPTPIGMMDTGNTMV